MTLYTISIGTHEYLIEISNQHAKINGKLIQAVLVELGEQGLFLLKKGVSKRELLAKALGNSQYSLNINGKHAVVQVEKYNSRSKQKTGKLAEGDIKAPISGIVVKVNVKVGDQAAKDDVVLVLESMKMQMLIRTPIEGTVKSIHVTPGSEINKGDLMVKVE